MTKVLAISGGIDSMVLLHMFRNDPDVVVAHFNHGTRPSATDDQLFVKRFAKKYHLQFFTQTAQLGENVSESAARTARYHFLRQVASQYPDAQIYTAHHANDLIESVAINLHRGTGWRGLAPLDSLQIVRPLLHFRKSDIYYYAAKHNIQFRQDPTNYEEQYLRNRLRPQIASLPNDVTTKLLQLSSRQKELKKSIQLILDQLIPQDSIYQRAWFFVDSPLGQSAQLELLRAALARNNISATRPQLLDFLNAIRTYQPGKLFNLPGGCFIKLHKNYFKLP